MVSKVESGQVVASSGSQFSSEKLALDAIRLASATRVPDVWIYRKFVWVYESLFYIALLLYHVTRNNVVNRR